MFAALDRCRAGLRARYAEPHRAYHGQAHVDAMLAGLPLLVLTGPAAAELAVWYHDAVYDPTARDNEERSAALLLADLHGLVDPAVLDAAAAMIRATSTHALPAGLGPDAAADCAAFLDLDLAVLGAPAARYDEYEAGIAAEYVPVHGAEAFRRGRAGFLRDMLARPRLFLTDAAHAALDAAARANLGRALGRLTG